MTGTWLTFSLVITASYGGNLRAFLLRPRFSEPIDNMEKIVNSGLPWTMALFGEEIEFYLQTSQVPVERDFWEGKTVREYAEFPIEEVTEAIQQDLEG